MISQVLLLFFDTPLQIHSEVMNIVVSMTHGEKNENDKLFAEKPDF